MLVQKFPKWKYLRDLNFKNYVSIRCSHIGSVNLGNIVHLLTDMQKEQKIFKYVIRTQDLHS